MHGVARHRDARTEQLACVGLILDRDSDWNGLQALKASGRLEIGALFAAMQRGAAFGTVAADVDVGAQSRGAVEAARSRYRLHQTRQARAGDVDGRTRSGWGAGALIAPGVRITPGFRMR